MHGLRVFDTAERAAVDRGGRPYLYGRVSLLKARQTVAWSMRLSWIVGPLGTWGLCRTGLSTAAWGRRPRRGGEGSESVARRGCRKALFFGLHHHACLFSNCPEIGACQESWSQASLAHGVDPGCTLLCCSPHRHRQQESRSTDGTGCAPEPASAPHAFHGLSAVNPLGLAASLPLR
jgi:hypothetical protein